MKGIFIVSSLAIASAFCAPEPSVFGQITTDIFPPLKSAIDEAFVSAVDEVTATVTADIEEFINQEIDWLPDFMQTRIIKFLHNRVTGKIANTTKISIKRHVGPKVDIILDNINTQLLILDKEIDQSIREVRNNIRLTAYNLPPLPPVEETAPTATSDKITATNTTASSRPIASVNLKERIVGIPGPDIEEKKEKEKETILPLESKAENDWETAWENPL